MKFDSIPDIVNDIRLGKMVILVDDEDRENEGDLIMAADLIRPEDINFMARYGRGLICLTLTQGRCEQLELPLMVRSNGARYSTNFTLSIEAAQGVTTGISAADRATTIQTAVAPGAKPSDIVQPGHIFPIMAQPGGVLNRAGHTEAGCDLARLAGREPSAVITEILNEDGTMARRDDLEIFAKEHGLKMGTIADLIEYRRLHEKTIERCDECDWPTNFGNFRLISYRDTIDGEAHFALQRGEIKPDEPTLVRVHLADSLQDLLAAKRDPKSWTLHRSMQRIADEGSGVIVLLGSRPTADELLQRVSAYAKEDKGEPVAKPDHDGGLRTIGIGSQILADLNIKKLRLLSSPKKYHALSGFKLEVVEYINE